MPTLSSANTVFQLAFGVNAVLPVLVADFERVRTEAAHSLLRKIKEYRPDFELKERDRLDFVDFTLRSSPGLRSARLVTHLTALLSLAFCGLSLAALCWAALSPEHQISSKLFFTFVALTLIFGPLFYIARDRYLVWLYKVIAIYGTNEKNDALLFAQCVETYLEFKKTWEPLERQANELMLEASRMTWKVKLSRVQMKIQSSWLWVKQLF